MGEMAGYVEKGKCLSTNYLCSDFVHLLAPLEDDLSQQVDRLTINRDVFVGRWQDSKNAA